MIFTTTGRTARAQTVQHLCITSSSLGEGIKNPTLALSPSNHLQLSYKTHLWVTLCCLCLTADSELSPIKIPNLAGAEEMAQSVQCQLHSHIEPCLGHQHSVKMISVATPIWNPRAELGLVGIVTGGPLVTCVHPV